MSTLDDIAQERKRIGERLARLDAERAKLGEELAELETTERVLSRFGKSGAAKPRRGRAAPARATAASGAGHKAPRRRASAAASAKEPQALPLSEATMRAVQAHGDGVSADAVRSYLAKEFGLQVRPNHLGMALQRHRRAGRLENRDSLWWVATAAAPAS